jgi:DNA-binding NarL/FixJ family response regulator
VVGEAGDYGELRAPDAARSPCDVLVLDINLPGRSGLDVLHALKDEGSPIRVLVVSPCTRKTSTPSAPCAPAPSATSTRAATRR